MSAPCSSLTAHRSLLAALRSHASVVPSGDEETPLSAVRPCGMGVPPSEALDMSRSLHLTIGYLLKIGYGDLESQVGWLR